MKTAIIHYWLVNDRGGEKVLAELAKLSPDADLFTHVYDPQAMPESIRRMNIRTTFIQKLPFSKKLYQLYLPLMPWALRHLDLSGYDLIISSESGPAKGIRKPEGATHICYCHTPMRYLWDLSDDYYQNASPLKKLGMKLFIPWLKKWDLWSATQVDHFIANSQFVADRIKRVYGREATVLHPPVDTEHFLKLKRDPQDFYLFFGQLTAYKRADLAIGAFNRLGKKLVVAGAGEEFHALEKMAGPNIEMLGRVSDEKRDQLYSQAKALIFPGVEDFGIIPLEAQAAGCPVIAYGEGGALETVVDGRTGLFFKEQTAESLCDAVEKFQRVTAKPLGEDGGLENMEAACRKNAARFSSRQFSEQITAFVSENSPQEAEPA